MFSRCRLFDRRSHAIALGMALALLPCLRAVWAGPPPDEQTSRLVSQVTHGSVHLVSTFPGPTANNIGVIGQDKAGKKLMAWMVDGRYLATGPLFSAEGENLTLSAATGHGLVAKPMLPGELARAAMAAKGLTLGRGGPLVVAFEDPNCIYCHKLSEEAAPLLAAGKLRLRVIPVGFLKPDSARKSAAILTAREPSKAWERNEAVFDDATEVGGIAPAEATSPVLADVKANTDLLSKSGALGTPVMVICRKGTTAPGIVHGMTPGMLAGAVAGAGSVTDAGGCASAG